jgi:Leucine-rich repeat (LRR) protein
MLLAFCLGLFLYVACKKSGGGIDGQDETLDTTPPLLINDLTVIEMTPNTVRLRWTATGDDRDTGRAAAYDLRYLHREITAINWDSAAPVQSPPLPGQPNTHDSASVTGLLQDSTYYFAIKVADEAGNWSNLSNVVQAVCFDNYAVTFADTAFERVVRFYVGKPSDPVLRSDLLAVWTINASGQHIHDLSGIEHCRNLHSIQLWNNSVGDLSPLAGLNQLRVLKIGYNGLTDISALAPLADLDTLHLNANAITDLSALAGMHSLTELVLTSNTIWYIAPLTGKTTIRNLSLDGNQIVFVNALYDLAGLEKLSLSNNQIDDILALAANSGLSVGDSLWLTGNPLSAPTTDSLVTELRGRGVAVIY